MNPREIAKWLANVDESCPCTDEQFAETMVYLWKYSNDCHTDLSAYDMKLFDVDKFCCWLNNCLGEILFSEEIDVSAWWKKKTED